jgi:hypothetical protein
MRSMWFLYIRRISFRSPGLPGHPKREGAAPKPERELFWSGDLNWLWGRSPNPLGCVASLPLRGGDVLTTLNTQIFLLIDRGAAAGRRLPQSVQNGTSSVTASEM